MKKMYRVIVGWPCGEVVVQMTYLDGNQEHAKKFVEKYHHEAGDLSLLVSEDGGESWSEIGYGVEEEDQG